MLIWSSTFNVKRKIADEATAAGFYAVVPDFIHGDPFAFDKPDRPLPIWLKDHSTVGYRF